MKFVKQSLKVANSKTEQKDLEVEALCLKRVAITPDLSDVSGKSYIVTLIGCGMGLVSTRAMHGKPGKLKDAIALAIAVETQIPEDIEQEDARMLMKATLDKIKILVAQFRHGHELDAENDTVGVLQFLKAIRAKGEEG